jgi:hypothetical protein
LECLGAGIYHADKEERNREPCRKERILVNGGGLPTRTRSR